MLIGKSGYLDNANLSDLAYSGKTAGNGRSFRLVADDFIKRVTRGTARSVRETKLYAI